MGGCLSSPEKKQPRGRPESMNKSDIVLPEPQTGNKKPVNNSHEPILFTQASNRTDRTDSGISGSHLSPLPTTANSLKLLITPVMSEEHLLWDDGASPSFSEQSKKKNKHKVRAFKLK